MKQKCILGIHPSRTPVLRSPKEGTSLSTIKKLKDLKISVQRKDYLDLDLKFKNKIFISKEFNKISPSKEKKLKEIPKKLKTGIVYFRQTKRNIRINLCNMYGKIKACLSIGLLKVNNVKLKVKARRAKYNQRKLALTLGTYIYKEKYKSIYLKFKTKMVNNLFDLFVRILDSNKKFKLSGIYMNSGKAHNGCRQPKIRRK